MPANGIRAADNLDALDSLDARDVGRCVGGPPCVDTEWTGDGGGCTSEATGGVTDPSASALSPVTSTGACASRRDNEEGPAAVSELPLPREASALEVGDWRGKGSSTSGSGLGSPGVGSGVATVVGGSDGCGEVEALFADRRFEL